MMTIHIPVSLASLLALFALVSPACWSQAPLPQDDVLTRLRASPQNSSLIVEAKSAGKDREAKAILNEELEKRSCGQWTTWLSLLNCGGLANELQVLDPGGRAGEKLLVGWVEEFLAQSVPPAFAGEPVGDDPVFNPEYLDWSRQHGLSADENVIRETMYGQLLRILGSMGDPKLGPLFRRGLESNSWAVASAATFGLALLADKKALPSILACADRQKPHGLIAYYMMLAELRNYDDPDVDRLIQTRIADKDLREAILRRRAVPVRTELQPHP